MNLFVSRGPLLPWPCKAYIPSIPTVEENKTSFGYPLTIDVGLRIVLLNEVCLTMRSALLWSRGGNHGSLISGLCFYKAGLDLTLPSSETGSPDSFTFWGSISPKELRKGLNTLIIMFFWKFRNTGIYVCLKMLGPTPPCYSNQWQMSVLCGGMAGATKLQELLMRSLAPPA